MSLGYVLLVGLLVGVAVYLLLHPDTVEKVLGLVLLGHAANLTVLGAGELARARAPILDGQARVPADPLPQALVLTAIVIGLGLVSFAIVLVARSHQTSRGVSA